jgi:uncharacterized protein YndB with AHSA1/START domain
MSQETTRKVARSIQIQAEPGRVLNAFLELDELRQWWGVSDGLVEARKGGVWTLVWRQDAGGYRYAVSGVIKSLAPGKRLRIEPLVYMNAERTILGPMRLSLALSGKEGRTRIRVRQDGYQQGAEWDWYYQAVQTGWTEALKNLKRHLEGPSG